MSNTQNKLVLNLSDVDKNPLFIDSIPEDILFYHSLDKRFSRFMVENAQSIVDQVNYYICKSPKSKQKTQTLLIKHFYPFEGLKMRFYFTTKIIH